VAQSVSVPPCLSSSCLSVACSSDFQISALDLLATLQITQHHPILQWGKQSLGDSGFPRVPELKQTPWPFGLLARCSCPANTDLLPITRLRSMCSARRAVLAAVYSWRAGRTCLSALRAWHLQEFGTMCLSTVLDE
jgi:hypothetical protein